MGRKKEEQEEYALIEFLYKDMNYIESFYSQVFQGDIKKILKNSSNGQIVASEVKGTVGVIGGTVKSNDENKEGITEEIAPHDSKIMKLFEEVHPRFCNKTNEAKLNGLNKFHGLIEITDYDITKEQFDYILSTNLIDSFIDLTAIDIPETFTNSNLSIFSLIKTVLQFQPSGCDAILTLSNKEKILIPIEKQYLTMKSEDINRVYGSKMSGEWNVIGILNSARRTSTDDTLNEALFTMQNAIYEALNTTKPSYVLKPIIIYRKLK